MGERADTATLRTADLPTLAPCFWRAARRSAGHHLLFPLLQPWLAAAEYLPRRASESIWSGIGSAAAALVPGAYARASSNIRCVFGADLHSDAVRAMAVHSLDAFARNSADVPRLRRLSRSRLLDLVEIRGLEKLERALAARRGVVGIAPHMGNWEVLACYLSARGVRVSAVAAALCDPRLGRYLADVRARWGVATIVKDQPRASRDAIAVLRRGEMLGTLMDLHTRGDAIRVPFLGRPSRVPAGPVRLALRTGAALVPMWIVRGSAGRYSAEVLDPIDLGASGSREADVERGVRRAAAVLSEIILARPAEWLWMHNRWPADVESA
ncbi:MAG: lysophospholipid acyltransferase family protein [bacterium]